MGYPMTYQRVVRRNWLQGEYGAPAITHGMPAVDGLRAVIAGDMRRLEQDQRDDEHLARYAQHAGVTPEQAKTLLDAFFEGLP